MRRALLCVAMTLVLAGTAAAALAPSAYRASATAICKGSFAKLRRVPGPHAAKDIGPYLKAAVPIAVAQYNNLKKLAVPGSFAATHAKVLKLEAVQIAGAEKLISTIDAGGDPIKSFALYIAQSKQYSDAEDAAWKVLGVPACIHS